ncbi:MAG: DUF2264 domain-containing protein [Lachnospiraceae bacterium]|nr:DUF2264 domain-containing protein [Lachnospiraceae bacterium]
MNKAEYRQWLFDLLMPLKDRYSGGRAHLVLGANTAGYGNYIAGMEGFSRVLWGLVPFWHGGGVDDDFAEIYRIGLISGTDPHSAEYWGDLGHRDQRMVEMAAISYGILLTPEYLWEPLDDRAKQNLVNWMSQVNMYDMPENNWQFFAVLVNLALKSVGAAYDEGRIQKSIDYYESFYLGNGWYADGKRPQKDYYVSFAIHFYCLLYSRFEADGDEATKERCEIYRQRAKEFAKDFVYWFDDKGRGLPFGRSLTYRFAQVAFFSAALLAGVDVLPLEVVKGIIERNLRYWIKQPIYDNAGVLTIGVAYPNSIMSENYNAPGSPYWALKSFAFLALEDSHPFWSCEAADMPKLSETHLIKEADMLMLRRENEVVALTSGQFSKVWHTHTFEKYAKFAYSTEFGFSVPRSYLNMAEAAPDSMLAFEVDGRIYVRGQCEEYEVSHDKIYSKWSPCKGIVVETTLIPTEVGYERRHVIESKIECKAYECGFSYPYKPYGEDKTITEISGAYAKASDSNGFGSIKADVGEGMVIVTAAGTNVLFPLACIPTVQVDIPRGRSAINSEIIAHM